MYLTDVNVLVYAHREDTENHEAYRKWLENLLNGVEAYALSEQVLSGFLRVVTHPRIFARPSPLNKALQFVNEMRNPEHCKIITPGPRHWDIFVDLCKQVHAKGNLVTDAYSAALAIESSCTWISTDHDFSRFPGLHWKNPLKD